MAGAVVQGAVAVGVDAIAVRGSSISVGGHPGSVFSLMQQ